MTSVITNSVNPTAKIVLYSIEPVGMSPLPVAPMNAVIVSIVSRGSKRDLRELAGGDEDDHRLADGARERQHERRDDPGDRSRDDDLGRDLELVGAERVAAVAKVARDGGHRVLGERRDGRDQHDPEHEARRRAR